MENTFYFKDLDTSTDNDSSESNPGAFSDHLYYQKRDIRVINASIDAINRFCCNRVSESVYSEQGLYTSYT